MTVGNLAAVVPQEPLHGAIQQGLRVGAGVGYMHCWADGLHFGGRLDHDRVCTLVVIGVGADGTKELAA